MIKCTVPVYIKVHTQNLEKEIIKYSSKAVGSL
jgi:hypothetical protein